MIFSPKSRETQNLSHLNVGNHRIEIVKEYNYLGLKIDDKLNFINHVKMMIKNLGYKMKMFRRMRNYIDKNIATLLYKSMISPIFSYANSFIFGAPKKLLKKLQTLQNQFLRIILKVNRRTNVDEQRNSLKILSTYNERKLSLLCLAYRNSFSEANRDHRELRTRSYQHGRRQMKIPMPCNQRYLKSYLYSSRKWWNSLPSCYHKAVNIGQFKNMIKNDIELLYNIDCP